MTPQLHPYQWYSVKFIESHPKCGLFLDMGLGKAIDDETILPTPNGRHRTRRKTVFHDRRTDGRDSRL